MIRSMTGYGQAVTETELYRVLVEMRSVNHRFLEIAVRLPKEFLSVEEVVKRKIGEQVKRGKIDVYISFERRDGKPKKMEVDWLLAEQYAQILGQLKDRFQLDNPVKATEFIQIPEIIQLTEGEASVEEIVEPLLLTVESACQQLLHMRKSEGKILLEDLSFRIGSIRNEIDEIRLRGPVAIQHYREKLMTRMRDLLPIDIDANRLLAEAALFAEKVNIEEELVRLASHCTQFLSIVESPEPVGRKLDFLVQEMNREVNTIGSKANDIEISKKVVELKAELEKIKEQVQNIE